MNKNFLQAFILSGVLFWLGASSFAQTQPLVSRFSHKGIKGLIGVGSFENEADEKFKDGDAGVLGLGYGFDDRFTLWLTLLGVRHPETAERAVINFGGLEAHVQYKLLPQSRIQPYGKVGVGLYGFEEEGTNTTLLGSGFALGLGADWFFSRHFGIGAEIMFKELDYSKVRQTINGEEITTDLKPQRDGDVVGFMITLTIQ
jgi:hypothetical protein